MSELKDGKHIKLKEYILYVLAVFFYTNMTGMINEYRRAYLVDILQLTTHQMSFFNVFTGVAGFALSFINAMILDSKKIKNGNKFKGLGIASAIPCGIITVLIFWTPDSSRAIRRCSWYGSAPSRSYRASASTSAERSTWSRSS